MLAQEIAEETVHIRDLLINAISSAKSVSVRYSAGYLELLLSFISNPLLEIVSTDGSSVVEVQQKKR